MAAIPVQQGAAMPLHLQLGSGNTGKFVRAILKDVNGAALPSSPVPLDDTGDGTYQKTTVNMPNEQFVIVAYKVFDDAAYTVPSELDGDGVDVFYQPQAAEATVRKDRIFGVVKQVKLGGVIGRDQLIGHVAQAKLSGVFDQDTLKGKLRKQKLTGVIEHDC